MNRGGVLEVFARARFPKAEIVATDDNGSLPELLASGQVEAIVTDSFEIAHFRKPGDTSLCVAQSFRKVYWVAPARAEPLGPRARRVPARARARAARPAREVVRRAAAARPDRRALRSGRAAARADGRGGRVEARARQADRGPRAGSARAGCGRGRRRARSGSTRRACARSSSSRSSWPSASSARGGRCRARSTSTPNCVPRSRGSRTASSTALARAVPLPNESFDSAALAPLAAVLAPVRGRGADAPPWSRSGAPTSRCRTPRPGPQSG